MLTKLQYIDRKIVKLSYTYSTNPCLVLIKCDVHELLIEFEYYRKYYLSVEYFQRESSVSQVKNLLPNRLVQRRLREFLQIVLVIPKDGRTDTSPYWIGVRKQTQSYSLESRLGKSPITELVTATIEPDKRARCIKLYKNFKNQFFLCIMDPFHSEGYRHLPELRFLF